MSRECRYVSSILLAFSLYSTLALSSCSVRASYRVRDASYGDYHTWDSNEGVYYQRWEVETHRDHRDFRNRRSDEQKEYWTWRHEHQ
jgi:hypothetical protein